MGGMFYQCSNLTSLNLSNFNTSSVIRMDGMFYGCSNLISLNLSNFDTSSVMNMDDMFNQCNNLENINLINAKINLNIITSSSIFSNLSSNLIICTENEDWSKIFNLSDKQYVNCINNISSFNINKNVQIIKCYKKNINLYNPCQMCGNNYFNESGIINNTYINCYENYYINDTSFLQLITTDYSYYESSIIIENEIEIKNKTELIENMINNLFDKFNISEIDNGKDEKTGDKNISIIITSTKNQKKNENEKMITMNLGECENILKKEYNISLNDPLYILLIISEEEESMKIPKIEYEIYYPFYNNNTLTKLDLNLCKETKIEVSIPVKINDNLDKHNPKSGYYNDICYKTTSEVEQI